MSNKLGTCVAVLLVAIAASVGAQVTPSAVQQPASQTEPAATPDLVPVHPATAEQIHEYYKLTHAIEMAHSVMDQMVSGMQATSAPYLPKAFWDDMRNSFANFDLESSFIPAYQKYFSEEDMATVIAFYKSPAGQHLLESQPLIISAAQDQLRKAGQTIGREVYLRHKDEIDTAKKKYDADQASAAVKDQKK